MTGRTPSSQLQQAMSPQAQERASIKAIVLRQEMALMDLRRARALSQEDLAQTLSVGQTAISKMEKRTDMYVSSLRKMIEAMGGHLEVVARFPEGDIHISNFKQLDATKPSSQI